jgi:hypothetical protein
VNGEQMMENDTQAGEGPICKVCETPGCIDMRGPNFHEGRRFGSKRCDYAGTPPFADAEWAGPENDALPNPYRMCEWCAGTGHPHGDESYGICECPDLSDNAELTGNPPPKNEMETDQTADPEPAADSPEVAGCPAPICCAAWVERLSTRARSALMSLGVKTFNDVVRVVGDGSFGSLSGVGIRTYNEVSDSLWREGFRHKYAPRLKPHRQVKKWNFDPITGKRFKHNDQTDTST